MNRLQKLESGSICRKFSANRPAIHLKFATICPRSQTFSLRSPIFQTGSNRFLASQAIQFVLPGVPATYIHSILGSRNWDEGVMQTQRARTINREKLQVENVISQLKDPISFRYRIFFLYIELIKIRKRQPAFHPNAAFEVLEINPKVICHSKILSRSDHICFNKYFKKHVSVSLSENRVPSRM